MGTQTYCLSSHMMTHLISWRNPYGSEQQWECTHQNQDHPLLFGFRIFTTEVSLALIATTAVVESIAYTIFIFIVSPFSTKAKYTFAQLLNSSFFTVIWSVANALVFNFASTNIYTNETSARNYFFKHKRQDDALPFDPKESEKFNSLNDEGKIDLGAQFIKNYILKNVDKETLSLFKGLDCTASIYPFVMTKAVTLFVIGSHRKKTIPPFFKDDTIKGIKQLREEFVAELNSDELATLFSSVKNYDKGTEDDELNEIIPRLRVVAFGELQESIFTQECWYRAAGIPK